MENATPMLRQYLDIKKRYPGTILFFRLGDFYEMFNEDAITGSRELEITLTARQKGSDNPIPMCGIPYHAAANYISRLVKKGYRVAICEQTESPEKGVKLVKRDVVRVITPGTAVDTQLADSRMPIYLCSIAGADDNYAAAFIDLSSGEFEVSEFAGSSDAWKRLVETVNQVSPSEIVVPLSLHHLASNTFDNTLSLGLPLDCEYANSVANGKVVALDEARFSLEDCADLLCRQFQSLDLAGFGLFGKDNCISAAGAALGYVADTQKTTADHISEIRLRDSNDCLVLDSVTLQNLEIVQSRGGDKDRSLLDVIDESVSSMGCRLLRAWLTRPSVKRSEIQTRQAAVAELLDSVMRGGIRHSLREVGDMERLIGRINLSLANPRDLIALKNSLTVSPKINSQLSDCTSLLLQVLAENIFELPEIRSLVERAIEDEPAVNLINGGVIKTGFDKDLDELRSVSTSGKKSIAAFEEEERNRSGISNLKVRYNSVFGYYIEVSKSSLAKVPEHFERRQTLANAERYTTARLKDWERSVLGAEERIIELERRLFEKVISEIRSETQRIQCTARALATLDALTALAETAAKRNYICPVLHDGDELQIVAGRHPVVEAFSREPFIPNDTYLNNSTDRLLIITGANMGGKSTVLRQVALIQILAQVGSFVPATSASLPIVDRIWTRVGASDDLASGRSTFMVEMTETAKILHSATTRSIILLDEIGRGTSTFDGLSIAWAVAEYLHNSPEHAAKTMFATHYHELTELADNMPGAKNYQITATETDEEIVFLHKLQKGKASKSYGIAVAKLAGMPKSVLERAKDVLSKLEQYELAVFSEQKSNGLPRAAARSAASQFSLFAISNEGVIDELRSLDLDALPAESAKSLIQKLKQKIV
jgi:DNA mismatch repair protein MutS